MEELTPSQIVAELDKYIIGQKQAKRAIAVALRNRYRRRLAPSEVSREISPKNIIMIGSTGVGKTEIARRIAKLTGSPFLKVEATKYTEVGYVGRDVESMIRDLMNLSINMVKEEQQSLVSSKAEEKVEEIILDALFPKNPSGENALSADTRLRMLEKLRDGEFDQNVIEIVPPKPKAPIMDMGSGILIEDIQSNFGQIIDSMGFKPEKKKSMSVSRAREILRGQEIEKQLDQDQVVELAKKRVEEMGIVFIDEIDKIISNPSASGRGEVSREGVQRDILPLIEGSQVNTKYGIIDTTHILFIAAGAFHSSKPSDLMPELQGRFPVQVKLEDLTEEDFYAILSQPKYSLVSQYKTLLEVEGITLTLEEEALKKMAYFCVYINEKSSNTGARRLHTLMEQVLEDILYEVPDSQIKEFKIDSEYVEKKLKNILNEKDLNRYIL